MKDSWEAARKDADLEHVRFHDLRHTAATRLARKMELVFVGHVKCKKEFFDSRSASYTGGVIPRL